MKNEMYSWNKSGMKMIIDSDYKEFDKQTNYLTTGNALCNTQYSNYIRPYNEVINPVGNNVEKGVLRDYDLKFFSKDLMTNAFKSWLDSITRDYKVVVYEYFIWRNGKKEVIGWLVQNTSTNEIIGEQRNYFSSVRQKNCGKVLDFCKRFLEMEMMNCAK